MGQITEVPTIRDASILEKIDNPSPSRSYEVTLHSKEFTSLCPVTGQADFGEVKISYSPDRYLIETKSLKMYLASYRNEKLFNEQTVNAILDDLVEVLHPKSICIHGIFSQRGGIQLTVKASHPDS
ncbi:MAG: preQ(1) synthase [Verrucomicrobiota bacterium]|nr:preQ(1) synthase [Verrucomicrobiota bacterium]